MANSFCKEMRCLKFAGIPVLLLYAILLEHGEAEYQPNTQCYDRYISDYPGRYPSCQFYAKNAYCTHKNHTNWMTQFCKRSCGLCRVTPGVEHIRPFIFATGIADVNMSLYSSTIGIMKTRRQRNCFRRCSRITRVAMRKKWKSKCLSINIKIADGARNITCEFNKSTKEINPERFHSRKSYVYYQLVFT